MAKAYRRAFVETKNRVLPMKAAGIKLISREWGLRREVAERYRVTAQWLDTDLVGPPMHELLDPCPVCRLAGQGYADVDGYCAYHKCDRCGIFAWSPSARTNGDIASRVKLSGFIRDQNSTGVYPIFSANLIKQVEQIAIPSLEDRARRLLVAMTREGGLNARLRPTIFHRHDFEAITYSVDANEIDLLAEILIAKGYIKLGGRGAATLNVTAFIAAENLTREVAQTAQCFVAMSFNENFYEAYVAGFDPAIRDAGYSPIRIDQKDHAGPISDAILSEIRHSRFIVADYTDQNNGVYFEAGFALGLGLQVIATCRSDYFDRLHFDIRHINTLKWDNPEDLVTKLAKRISAVMGDGPNKRPQ